MTISHKYFENFFHFSCSVHVKGNQKQCDILFDCGTLEERTLTARHVFITHGHIDHIGACISHARAKSLNSSGATYYVPLSCLEGLIQAKQAFEILEGKEIPMKIVGISPNEIVQITKAYKVLAFPTIHRVPSQGYAIIHCHHGGLLPSYTHCTQQEISALHRQGITVNSISERFEVVYTGDTVFNALLEPELSFLFTSEILLIEMTYLDGDRNKVAKHCHIHLDDFLEYYQHFQNQQIIFMHVSSRYGTGYRVLDILKKRLPQHVLSRCAVGLKSFGFNQSITLFRRNEGTSQIKRSGSGNILEYDDGEEILLSDQCLPCDDGSFKRSDERNQSENESGSIPKRKKKNTT